MRGFTILLHYITRRMQCIVGSLYAVYTAAIFGVVQNCGCKTEQEEGIFLPFS